MSTTAASAYAHQLRQLLSTQANAAKALPMAAYMKQRFEFFGIPTPIRRQTVRPVLAQLGRLLDTDGLLSVAHALWRFPERECQYVAVDLLVKYASRFEPRHEPEMAALIQAKSWWDSVDLLATHVYGSLCRHCVHMQARMKMYAQDDNLWLRRVAILHQLTYGAETDRERLSAILTANLDHGDFFIRKAMGWALRQLARTDPDWVRAWIETHAQQVSGLTRREALKHL